MLLITVFGALLKKNSEKLNFYILTVAYISDTFSNCLSFINGFVPSLKIFLYFLQCEDTAGSENGFSKYRGGGVGIQLRPFF